MTQTTWVTHGGESSRATDAPPAQAEVERHFATEAACRGYLVGLRWPHGFMCPNPSCGGRRSWQSARGLYRCVTCGRQTSPTAGTALAGTRLSVREWFEMLWLVAGNDGVNAETLRVALGLGSYETAWASLHKVRRAIAERPPARLAGVVKLAVYPLWNVEGGGRRLHDASTIALAAEVRGAETGAIRVGHVADAQPVALERFLTAAVTPGSTLRTNLKLGPWLADLGLSVEPVARTQHEVRSMRPDAVSEKLEEWCRLIHHGAISRRQLEFYLAEFEFRFNQRREPQALRFRRLLETVLSGTTNTRASLIGRPVNPTVARDQPLVQTANG